MTEKIKDKCCYDKNQDYTQYGLEIERVASIALENIARDYVEQGFSIREIANLFHRAVIEVECKVRARKITKKQ
jgi:hypothetical protein